ncbi:MAG: energy-coupling factor transporter ATPase [Candidatus Micrarchaeaceae archaeon]
MEKAVEIRKLYWRYPNFTGIVSDYALKGINLEIYKGEFFGITGASGAGKSTLCYTMLGLIPHQIKLPFNSIGMHFRGSVKVFGEIVSALAKGKGREVIIGKGVMVPDVGLVMQDPESQFLSMSVLHELSLGLQMQGLGKDEIERRVREALSIVGLEEMADAASLIHPSELSGGQKQRLIIASFIAMRPRLLILDEPTSDLDPAGKIEVIEAIERLRAKTKMTIVLVEHNPEIMLKFADRMAVMHNGSIVKIGRPKEIYSDIEFGRMYNIYMPEHAELSNYVNEDMSLKKVPAKGFRIKREAVSGSKESVIDIKGMSFRYEDGTQALSGINLRINKGEFVAIVGQNGSGKSTLCKVISGINRRFEGSVNVMGFDARDKRYLSKVPLYVGYVFQNPDHQIFARSVIDEVEFGLKNLKIEKSEARERATKILKRFNLYDKMDEDPLFLGRGQKRRLAVASTLVMDPKVLIVDEPTTGQDYRMTREIMEILAEQNSKGRTIIVITHDMRIVAEYCRRVVVMSGGTIIFDGTPESLFMKEDVMRKAALTEPESVRLSKKLMREGIIKDPLISAREWLEFFEFEKRKTKFEMFRYPEMLDAAKAIAKMFASRYGKPDGVLYIERGGMIPAALVARELGVGRLLHVSAGYYTDAGVPSKSVKIWSIDGKISSIKKGRILLIDDIADTGKTLTDVYKSIRKLTKAEIVTATFLYKSKSIIKPEFYYAEKDNSTWIIFDYEENETMQSFTKSKNKVGLDFLNASFGPEAIAGSKTEFQRIKDGVKLAAERIKNAEGVPAAIAYIKPSGNIMARLASDYLQVKAMLAIDADGDFSTKLAERIYRSGGYVLLVDDNSDGSDARLRKALTRLASAGLKVVSCTSLKTDDSSARNYFLS